MAVACAAAPGYGAVWAMPSCGASNKAAARLVPERSCFMESSFPVGGGERYRDPCRSGWRNDQTCGQPPSWHFTSGTEGRP